MKNKFAFRSQAFALKDTEWTIVRVDNDETVAFIESTREIVQTIVDLMNAK